MNKSVVNDAHHNWDENITNNRLYYHMIQKIILQIYYLILQCKFEVNVTAAGKVMGRGGFL